MSNRLRACLRSALVGASLLALSTAGAVDEDPASKALSGFNANIVGNFARASDRDCEALADRIGMPEVAQSDVIANRMWCAISQSGLGNSEDAEDNLTKAEALLEGSTDQVLLRLRRNTRMTLALDRGDLQGAIANSNLKGDIDPSVALVTQTSDGIEISGDGAETWNSDFADYDAPMQVGSGGTLENIRILDAQYHYLKASAYLRLARGAEQARYLDLASAELNSAGATLALVRQRQGWLRSDIALLKARVAQARKDDAGAIVLLQAAIPLERQSVGESARLAKMYLTQAASQRRVSQVAAAVESEGEALSILSRMPNGLGNDGGLLVPLLDASLQAFQGGDAKAAERFFNIAQFVTSASIANEASRSTARLAAGGGELGELIRRSQDAEMEVARLKAERQRAALEGADASDQVNAFAAEIAAAERDLESLVEERNSRFPAYAQLVESRTTLGRLAGALQDGQAYVRIFFAGRKAYGSLIDAQGIVIYPIALSADEAEQAIKVLRARAGAGVSKPEYLPEPAVQMFQTLFGPVRERLLAARSVVFEPHRSLGTLPIGILLTDMPNAAAMAKAKSRDYGGFPFLAKAVTTSVSVSGASFVAARELRASSADLPLAGFGDFQTPSADRVAAAFPISGLRDTPTCHVEFEGLWTTYAALPSTRGELEAVAASMGVPPDQLTLGNGFTDTGLMGRQDLSRYRVVYLATHGILPNGNKCLTTPGLLTSVGGPGSDGYLGLDEILGASKAFPNGLKLDAQVVVISACNSAGNTSSGETRGLGLAGGGDALSGLVRGFTYAGSRSVLVANWEVPDVATKGLLVNTFADAARGSSIADALRQAQTTYIATPAMSHPYYWAGFTVLGDGSSRVAVGG